MAMEMELVPSPALLRLPRPWPRPPARLLPLPLMEPARWLLRLGRCRPPLVLRTRACLCLVRTSVRIASVPLNRWRLSLVRMMDKRDTSRVSIVSLSCCTEPTPWFVRSISFVCVSIDRRRMMMMIISHSTFTLFEAGISLFASEFLYPIPRVMMMMMMKLLPLHLYRRYLVCCTVVTVPWLRLQRWLQLFVAVATHSFYSMLEKLLSPRLRSL
jgi:hypothetical protein